MGDQAEFDGLCPKNAACLHCGYLFGGLPIKGEVIICPECGEAVTFAFPPIGQPRERVDAKPAFRILVLCLAIGVILWLVGMPVSDVAFVTLILICVMVPISASRAVGRALLHKAR